MAVKDQRPYDWRGKAFHLAWKLDRAHRAVHVLGSALEEGHPRSARRRHRTVCKVVASVAEEVKTLRSEQPPTNHLEEHEATGSTLVIRGSGSATDALDVMVHAMTTLSLTEQGDDADVLIGACIDAEWAYQDGTAIVKAASQAHGSSLSDLERAFDTEGEVTLRKRVTADRTAVRAISERVEQMDRPKKES